jgi:hypothetical protein
MRKEIWAMMLLVVAISFQTKAQDTTHTLIKLIKPQTIGLYVAPEVSYGQVRGSMTGLGGASAMLVLNKKWAIGATAQMSLDDNFVPKAVSPLTVRAAWAGGKIEYTPRPDALIHVSFPLTIGAGEASTDSLSSTNGRGEHDLLHDGKGGNSNGNGFIIVQPGMNLEMNLMRYAKFYVGANYRLSFLSDNKTALLPANTLQGFSINAGLKVGLFDFKLNRKKAGVSEGNN